MSLPRSRHRSAHRRPCRFRPTTHSRSKSAHSAKRSSTTSASRSTAAWRAQVATSAAKASPTAKCRDAACPVVPSNAIPRPCGISPGPRRCFGTGVRAASKSRSRGRSSRPTKWRSRSPRLSRVLPPPAMVRAFTQAFPEAPRVDGSNLAKAIATYERTFVSPDTRFDRWIAGDEHALTQNEVAGFRLFTGKAGCVKCHSGFAFTDYAFHDIGLPGEDRGRGAVLRLAAAEHAFKTPGLREIARSAPYMHDGSLATLEDVLRHYASGVVDRPTLSKDLTRGLKLSDA